MSNNVSTDGAKSTTVHTTTVHHAATPTVTTVAKVDGANAPHHVSSGQAIFMNLLPFILIFVVFYFILILPQRRKQKAHKALMESLKVGDRVALSSGILGKVVSIKAQNIVVVKTAENTEIEVYRHFITTIIQN